MCVWQQLRFSLSNSQIYNTVLLPILTMLYIRFSRTYSFYMHHEKTSGILWIFHLGIENRDVWVRTSVFSILQVRNRIHRCQMTWMTSELNRAHVLRLSPRSAGQWPAHGCPECSFGSLFYIALSHSHVPPPCALCSLLLISNWTLPFHHAQANVHTFSLKKVESGLYYK